MCAINRFVDQTDMVWFDKTASRVISEDNLVPESIQSELSKPYFFQKLHEVCSVVCEMHATGII